MQKGGGEGGRVGGGGERGWGGDGRDEEKTGDDLQTLRHTQHTVL
jgi:hypothetical protein